MLDDDVVGAESLRRLARDRRPARARPSIGTRVYSMPVTGAPVVDVAHGADEQQRRAVRGAADLGR